MVICGALFRDLEWTKTMKFNKKTKQKHSVSKSLEQIRGSSSTLSSPSRSSMPEVDELRTILESGDITALFSSEELSDCPRLSSSLVNLPTFLHHNEPLPDEVINAFSRNEAAHSLISRHFPRSTLAKNLRGSVEAAATEQFRKNSQGHLEAVASENPNNNCRGSFEAVTSNEDKAEVTASSENNPEDKKSMVKLKRKVSSLFKSKPLRPILKKPRTCEDTEVKIEVDPDILEDLIPKRNLNNLRVRKQSLTYRGAMLSIPRYRLRASSCPDIYRNSMTTIALSEDETENCCQRSSSG